MRDALSRPLRSPSLLKRCIQGCSLAEDSAITSPSVFSAEARGSCQIARATRAHTRVRPPYAWAGQPSRVASAGTHVSKRTGFRPLCHLVWLGRGLGRGVESCVDVSLGPTVLSSRHFALSQNQERFHIRRQTCRAFKPRPGSTPRHACEGHQGSLSVATWYKVCRQERAHGRVRFSFLMNYTFR